MTFNELQKTWQKETTGPKLAIDSDLLLREVKRNKEAFDSAIFWRDFREVGTAVILVVVFLYGAFKSGERIWVAGSFVVLAITCLFVAVFFLVDRRLQKRKDPRHSDPLLACIESSLIKVNHQIWLLKNVFWWYLLPPGAGIALFFVVVTWNVYKVLHKSRVLLMFGANILIVALIFWGVYWLNQYVVRERLMPRKQELELLLNSLTNNCRTM
jgi:Flp pilus assembly protein TadB